MSDQANPAEIEDVLSSIRRLVAGGGKPASEPSAAEAPVPDPADPNPVREEDALVLTPSLRIGAETDAESSRRAWAEDAAADSAEADEIKRDAEGDSGDRMAEHSDADPDAETQEEEREATSEQTAQQEAAAETEPAGGEGADAGDPPDAAADDSAATDEPTRPEGLEFEHRKSPFLSETLMAKRAADRAPQAAPGEVQRAGFGFGAARREDPVRHVPLSALGRPQPDNGEETPGTSSRREERSLTLGLASSTSEPAATAEQEAEESGTGSGERAPPPDDPEGAEANAPASDAADAAPGGERDTASPMTDLDPAPLGSAASPDSSPTTTPPQSPVARGDLSKQTLRAHDADADVPVSEPGEGTSAAGTDPGKTVDVAATDRAAEPDEPSEASLIAAVTREAAPDRPAQDAPEHRSATGAHPGASVDDGATGLPAPGTDAADPLADGSEQTANGAPSPSDATDPGQDRLNVFGADVPTLSEEALRALVADVVHGELQGALGERVSHNLRQLVRREIARALESRGLD